MRQAITLCINAFQEPIHQVARPIAQYALQENTALTLIRLLRHPVQLVKFHSEVLPSASHVPKIMNVLADSPKCHALFTSIHLKALDNVFPALMAKSVTTQKSITLLLALLDTIFRPWIGNVSHAPMAICALMEHSIPLSARKTFIKILWLPKYVKNVQPVTIQLRAMNTVNLFQLVIKEIFLLPPLKA